MEAWASYCEPSATGNIVGSTLAANWSAAVFSASLPLPTSPRDISSRSFSDNDRRDRFLADGAMPPFDSSTPNTDVAHRGGDRASGDRGLKPLAGYPSAQMGRPGLSLQQKHELWTRWRAGQSLSDIGRALGKHADSDF